MPHEFQTPPLSYKPQGSPETPYLRAKMEWDSRIGATVVQAKNWRLAFFAASMLSTFLIASNFYQLSQKKLVPVIISVEKESGQPKIIGRADEVLYNPGEQEIKYFLSQFIRKVRAVPNDPVMIRENWLEAYKFLRRQASSYLNQITNSDEDSPLKAIGRKSVAIKPLSVTHVGSGNSYQTRWEESVYDQSGTFLERYAMVGIFSLEFEQPKDIKTMEANPLGIFISSFQWSREL